jgi:ribonuclease J
MPVKGEYRHLYEQKKIAQEAGFDNEHIVMMENGQVLLFEEGVLKEHSTVQVGDVLVDGSIIGDINEVVMKDREVLAQEGAILVISNICARTRQILTGPEIVTKGFVCPSDAEGLQEEIVKTFERISGTFMQKRYIEWNDFKNTLSDEISRMVFKTVHKRPIIIPVLIDTQV